VDGTIASNALKMQLYSKDFLRPLPVGLIRQHPALLHDAIGDEILDVLCITETWIPSDAPNAVKLDVVPSSYQARTCFLGIAKEKQVHGRS
jgi:hypothetical protein